MFYLVQHPAVQESAESTKTENHSRCLWLFKHWLADCLNTGLPFKMLIQSQYHPDAQTASRYNVIPLVGGKQSSTHLHCAIHSSTIMGPFLPNVFRQNGERVTRGWFGSCGCIGTCSAWEERNLKEFSFHLHKWESTVKEKWTISIFAKQQLGNKWKTETIAVIIPPDKVASTKWGMVGIIYYPIGFMSSHRSTR